MPRESILRLFGVIAERLSLLLCRPAEMLLMLLCKPAASGASWREPYIIEPTLLVRQRRGVKMVFIPTSRLMVATAGIRSEPFLDSGAKSGRWSHNPLLKKIRIEGKCPPFCCLVPLLPPPFTYFLFIFS